MTGDRGRETAMKVRMACQSAEMISVMSQHFSVEEKSTPVPTSSIISHRRNLFTGLHSAMQAEAFSPCGAAEEQSARKGK